MSALCQKKMFNVGFTPPFFWTKKMQYWFRQASPYTALLKLWRNLKDSKWICLATGVIYVSEIARQLRHVTFEWSHFGQTKALSCIFLTHFAIPCVRVVAWMWSSGRKWCQRCELTFTFLFKRPSAPLFVHVLHSLYALESFRMNNRNKNISTRRRAFTINSQKIRSKEVFP